ncbi:hypothetical protein U8Q05_25785 [Rhizobium ruizarguesonis]|nr:hypothetical protein U8Q05_25785 [Rhizobium ruizarguesonis]
MPRAAKQRLIAWSLPESACESIKRIPFRYQAFFFGTVCLTRISQRLALKVFDVEICHAERRETTIPCSKPACDLR